LVIPLICAAANSPDLAQAKRKIKRILKFLSELLGSGNFFGGENLSLGDIVAGNNILLINKLGFDLNQFTPINLWCDRLMEREPWQQTQPNDKQIAVFKGTVQNLIKS
ncbi:MAG: glutathione binding-like protein, partial [Cyanobacteria bacterium J06649_11]